MSKVGCLEVSVIGSDNTSSVVKLGNQFLKTDNSLLVDNPKDVWSLAKRIATDCEGSYTPQELNAIFGYVTIDEIFDTFSYESAKNKCDKWDLKRKKILKLIEGIAPGILIRLFDLEDCETEDDVIEGIILSYSKKEVEERVNRLEQCSKVDNLLQPYEWLEIQEIFGKDYSKQTVIDQYLRGELPLASIEMCIMKYKQSKKIAVKSICTNKDNRHSVVVLQSDTEAVDVYKVLDLQSFELLLCHKESLIPTGKMFSFEEGGE